MIIKPLKKEIYEKLKALNVDALILHFSGGNDEGYLDAELVTSTDGIPGELYGEIENWAWEVYSYSGAGEGNAYGDDITYNLRSNEASVSEWYTARSEGNSHTDKLQID
jgi:hypothetical protein